MKVRAWGIKFIAIITCGLFCIRSFHNIRPSIASAQKVIVHIDPLLAPQTRQVIATFIKEKSAQKIPVYSDFAQIIVQRFPCIKSVEIERDASGLLYYELESAMPIISINEHLALTDDGTLLLKNSFAPHVIQSLHNVDVPSGVITSDLRKNISTLVNDFLMTYRVKWISDQEIHIQNKQQEPFSILCNAQTIPNQTVLEKCLAIKNELINGASIEKVKTKQLTWVADVRFKNQIIVNSGLGSPSIDGANYGGQRYG